MELARDVCPDEETLLAFIQGHLRSERRSSIETHLVNCAICADLATWTADVVVPAPATDGHESQLTPGARVGRYQVLAAIGRGGMGEVYAAYHPDLDRRIALKVVYGSGAADPARQAQLLDEARIIARLDHPNIVTVHDAGVVGERVYVAMEFVDGQTVTGWLAERERTLPEILDAFLAAGRGLAAAHEAKVVHRDFKPQNVMIGRDGRVRVMDFGLARPLRDLLPVGGGARDASPAYPTTSTTIGAFIGTPAYVAPEQLAGGSVDVRADQYSFCVALHEALYGVRPGARQAPSSTPPPPKPRNVPPWLRSIVQRGTEPDRERRFQSVQALLTAIERGRTRRRRRFLAVAIATVALLIGLGGWRAAGARRFACTPPAGRIASAWPVVEAAGSRRASLHRMFLASGLADSAKVWSRLASVLDDHLAQWTSMYRDACEATHVRGEQSAEVLDLRMTCLAENLDEVRAFTDALATADRAGLNRAVATANSLSPVRQCADVKNLRLQVPLPSDPNIRAEVEHLQEEIKTAEALRVFGYSAKAEQELTVILSEARRVQYRPVIAQALLRLGMTKCTLYKVSEADAVLREAILVAETAHDDLTAAISADALGYATGTAGRYDDANWFFSLATAVLDRSHAQDSLAAAWLLNDQGGLANMRGDLAHGEAFARRAVELKKKLLGDAHPDVAISLGVLETALIEMDRWDEATAANRVAMSILEKSEEQSTNMVFVLFDRVEILIHQGRLDEAGADLQRLRQLEVAVSVEHSLLHAQTLMGEGELALARHDPAGAVAPLESAQDILIRNGEQSSIEAAVLKSFLARAFARPGGDRSLAASLADQSCAAFARWGYVMRERQLLEWFHASPFDPQDRESGCAELRRRLHAMRL